MLQVEDAKKVKHELEQEQQAVAALQDAMDRMDLKGLETAIAAAEVLTDDHGDHCALIVTGLHARYRLAV